MANDNHKQLIGKTPKELLPPLFSIKRTQEAAVHNVNILDAFNGNFGEVLEAQQGRPLHYGSEFRDLTVISNILYHHEDIDKIWT